ncbi:hypothetical protein KGY73_00225 [bacterium]|nr:hypothetical protein [bacterium]
MSIQKAITGFLLMASIPLAAAGTSLQVNGYYKSFFIGILQPHYQMNNQSIHKPTLGAVNNRLRLKFSSQLTHRLSLDFSYDFSPRIQDPSLFDGQLFFAQTEPRSYRFKDIPQKIYPSNDERTGSFALLNNLDRFFFTMRLNFADVYIGRQAISWGSARVINPSDVIAPFAFNELDVEERRGVDALRVRIPLGMMDELDIGFVAGKNFDLKESAYFLRSKFYVYRTDFSLLLMNFKQHLMMGFDAARSIGGTGGWFEAAYVIPFYKNKDSHPKETNYLRISTGLDYNLSSKTYGFLEYHFNSAGKNQPEDYTQEFQYSPFKDGTVYLLGKHYLHAGITYQITPLLPFNGLLIFNINDQSLTFSPTVEYNIGENIYLSGGAYIGLGENPEIPSPSLPSSPLIFHSEFGAYPDIFFTSFKIYF